MVFLYPTFLFGLLSLAIPVIIHLVELRRPKRVIFTNTRFLREVKEITASSRRLKRILILLSRLLALSALVLAFAQPFLPADHAATAPTNDARFYLDNSSSMQNTSRTAAVSLLDEAKSQIRQLTGAFSASTKYRLLDNEFAEGTTAIPATSLLDAIARVQLTARRNTSEQAVRRLLAVNDQVGAGTKVFVYSDFQRNSSDLKQLQVASGNAQLYLMPLEAQSTRNVYVDTVLLTDEFVRPAESNQLVVRVANSGSEKATGVGVKVFVDQQQVSAYSLDLAPGEQKATQVSFRVTGEGVKRGRVEISDLPVTFDNNYFFTLRAAPAIDVFGIGPKLETPAQKAFVTEPAFRYAGADERTINYQQAADADLLLVQELPAISAGVADNVRKFAQGGGSVLLIPAQSADRSSYGALFQSLGLTSIRWTTGGTAQPLRAPDTRDPFFSGVFTSPDAAMSVPKATPSLTWTRSTRDILRLRSGAPLLSGFRVGRGMVYVLASSLDPAASDFASNALFVPTLFRLAQQSYRAPQQLAYALGRQTISLPVKASDGRKQFFRLVRDDSTSFIPEQQIRDGRLIFSAPSEMNQAGFYTLRRAGEASTVLAFNYDKRESTLAQYTAAELKQAFAGNSRIHVYEAGTGVSAIEQFRAENVGEPLWKYCLVAALVFLLAEVLLVRFL
jgi:Aerotolerance regulator N-terminal/CARDB